MSVFPNRFFEEARLRPRRFELPQRGFSPKGNWLQLYERPRRAWIPPPKPLAFAFNPLRLRSSQELGANSQELPLSGRHHFLHALFHLCRGDIFHMGSDAPEMSERVLDKAGTISIELVRDRFQDFRSLRSRSFDDCVAIGEVHIQIGRAS